MIFWTTLYAKITPNDITNTINMYKITKTTKQNGGLNIVRLKQKSIQLQLPSPPPSFLETWTQTSTIHPHKAIEISIKITVHNKSFITHWMINNAHEMITLNFSLLYEMKLLHVVHTFQCFQSRAHTNPWRHTDIRTGRRWRNRT